jgi:hypothetical protein
MATFKQIIKCVVRIPKSDMLVILNYEEKKLLNSGGHLNMYYYKNSLKIPKG